MTSNTLASSLVSVIVPFFNRAKNISTIIQTLNAQTYQTFEVIFIDDFSEVPLSDSLQPFLSEILFEYRVLRNNENRGVSYSRNAGVRLSKGSYICFLDSDDEWYSTKIQKNIDACKSIEGSVFGLSKTEIVKASYIDVLPKSSIVGYSCGEEYLFENGLFAQVSSFFLSRNLALSLMFNESLSQYEDFLYFIQAYNNSENIFFIDEILVRWNDEDTEGRLSSARSYAQAATFLELEKDSIDKKYRQAFYLRFVMPYYFYSHFLKSVRCIFFCAFKSKIPIRTILWLSVRGVLGERRISLIRGVIKS